MKLKNSEINSVITFLDSLKLIGKSSIGRTKLKGGLSLLNEEYNKDQVTIINEFDGWVDESKTSFKVNSVELVDAMNALNAKDTVINIEDILFIDEFKEALANYKGELEGTDADAYAMLVLYFESKKEEEK